MSDKKQPIKEIKFRRPKKNEEDAFGFGFLFGKDTEEGVLVVGKFALLFEIVRKEPPAQKEGT